MSIRTREGVNERINRATKNMICGENGIETYPNLEMLVARSRATMEILNQREIVVKPSYRAFIEVSKCRYETFPIVGAHVGPTLSNNDNKILQFFNESFE